MQIKSNISFCGPGWMATLRSNDPQEIAKSGLAYCPSPISRPTQVSQEATQQATKAVEKGAKTISEIAGEQLAIAIKNGLGRR